MLCLWLRVPDICSSLADLAGFCDGLGLCMKRRNTICTAGIWQKALHAAASRPVPAASLPTSLCYVVVQISTWPEEASFGLRGLVLRAFERSLAAPS